MTIKVGKQSRKERRGLRKGKKVLRPEHKKALTLLTCSLVPALAVSGVFYLRSERGIPFETNKTVQQISGLTDSVDALDVFKVVKTQYKGLQVGYEDAKYPDYTEALEEELLKYIPEYRAYIEDTSTSVLKKDMSDYYEIYNNAIYFSKQESSKNKDLPTLLNSSHIIYENNVLTELGLNYSIVREIEDDRVRSKRAKEVYLQIINKLKEEILVNNLEYSNPTPNTLFIAQLQEYQKRFIYLLNDSDYVSVRGVTKSIVTEK